MAPFLTAAADLFARQPVTWVAGEVEPTPVAHGRPEYRWSPTVQRALGHLPQVARDFPGYPSARIALSAELVACGWAAARL